MNHNPYKTPAGAEVPQNADRSKWRFTAVVLLVVAFFPLGMEIQRMLAPSTRSLQANPGWDGATIYSATPITELDVFRMLVCSGIGVVLSLSALYCFARSNKGSV